MAPTPTTPTFGVQTNPMRERAVTAKRARPRAVPHQRIGEVLFGAALVIATVVYLTVSYSYIPTSVPEGDRVNAQTYTNVGFSAFISLVNGVYYIFAQRPRDQALAALAAQGVVPEPM